MGLAWIRQHHCGDLDAIEAPRACKDNVALFAREWGLAMGAWVPFLEDAIQGVEQVWHACPWIQTVKKRYNSELVFQNLEALRLGYPSGRPFHILGIPVFPSLDFYSVEISRIIGEELEEPRLLAGSLFSNAHSW